MTRTFKVLIAFLLISLSLNSSYTFAESLTGKVVGVSDGDTITILKDKTQTKIRLNGIDAPEKSQPFGNKSKQHLSDLVFGKQVRIDSFGNDRYGRTIGEIYEGEGPKDSRQYTVISKQSKSVNAQMVEAGFAWWFQKYAPKRKDLQALEEEARKEGRGLWSDPKPVPPWEFRKK